MSGAVTIEDSKSLRASLIELGYLRETELLEVLSGGVSGIVALALHEPEPFVAKCARARLDVPEDWFADPVRTMREARILRHLNGRLGPVAVPRVHFVDWERNLLGIQAFVPVPPTWQQQLLRGEVDESVACRVAGAVAVLHRLPVPDDLDAAEGDALFDQLRLDPYYRTVMRQHPELADTLKMLIRACQEPEPPALVHGDVSPKNVLVAADQVVLLDFEVIHRGEPAFDMGMLLGHLVLKAIYYSDAPTASAIAGLVTACWSAYQSAGGPARHDRVVGQLGGILLARVLGKSRVSYLEPAGQGRALGIAKRLLAGGHGVDELPALLREHRA